jgi:hypothetical protein
MNGGKEKRAHINRNAVISILATIALIWALLWLAWYLAPVRCCQDHSTAIRSLSERLNWIAEQVDANQQCWSKNEEIVASQIADLDEEIRRHIREGYKGRQKYRGAKTCQE